MKKQVERSNHIFDAGLVFEVDEEEINGERTEEDEDY